MEHFSVTFLPDDKKVKIHSGATLLDAAGQADIVLNTPCGGKGTCGKCRVQLKTPDKEVLACQYKVERDMTVIIPPQSRFYQQQILEHGIDRQIKSDPSVKKYYLAEPVESFSRLIDELSRQIPAHIHCDQQKIVEQIDSLHAFHSGSGITAVLIGCPPCGQDSGGKACYELICLEPDDTTSKLFGVAVDIGTTTVAARLLDLRTGNAVAVASDANPQARWGDNVISRIEFGTNLTGAAALQQAIVGCLNGLVQRLCRQAGIQLDSIYEMAAVGNTTMNHLLLKFPVAQLGQSPYKPHSLAAHNTIAQSIAVRINPCGNIYTAPNIAGFIGSDTLAASLAVGIEHTERMTLLADIGTNGEIVLGSSRRLLAASCAAGPALEGARILHGGRAVPGAIQRVLLGPDDLDLDVIGDIAPGSICGSGLIDALAVLIELRVIDQTGKFGEKDALAALLPPALLNRIVEYKSHPAFVLAGIENDPKDRVILTQADVRQLQLAKAAIRTGIQAIQNRLSVPTEQIEQVLLAGAFGNYITPASAIRIGLLPNLPLEKIHFVGNAACCGAEMILLSHHLRRQADRLAEKIEYVEIAAQPDFHDMFSQNLLFD